MRVVVQRPGCYDGATFDCDVDTTVEQIKQLTLKSIGIAAESSVKLVCGGLVLCDSTRLSDLVSVDAPVLWLLFGATSTALDKQLLSYAYDGGIFPHSSKPPSQVQEHPHSAYPALLRGFEASFVAATRQWTVSEDEKRAFSTAVSALESTEPRFKGAPHVTWFGEYGCALLANSTRVGLVQLRLVALDMWRFRMHSEASGLRTHTADAGPDAACTLHIGEVALADYVDFLCERRARTEAP